jgi:hypothetical protein
MCIADHVALNPPYYTPSLLLSFLLSYVLYILFMIRKVRVNGRGREWRQGMLTCRSQPTLNERLLLFTIVERDKIKLK